MVKTNARPAHLFDFNGVHLTIAQFAKIIGVSAASVNYRIHRGYAPNAKLTQKIAKTFSVDGRTMTARTVANAYGIPLHKVYNTLYRCRKNGIELTGDMFVK